MEIASDVDREGKRIALEEARAAYHALVSRITPTKWSARSGNPDLLIKELVWHMAWAMGWLARGVEATRSERRSIATRLPGSVMDPLRKVAMRFLARTATPTGALRKYDEGHHALIELLAAVRDDEWSLSTKRFGETRTLAWHFVQPIDHFAEHASDVEAALESRE